MGLGMLACVPAARVDEARRVLEAAGERVFEVGDIAPCDVADAPVEFIGASATSAAPSQGASRP
jgi:hypothetical protein